MFTPSPQEAFHLWLRDSLGRALSALTSDEAHIAYLAQSVDHADLQRRQHLMNFR